ncbi:NAD(P)-dependent dehydrogenase (short-subunit alcohol dehydrogenase family) [Rhodanobacter sp. ANJX3]|uniref:oxidoreductase n=1 Tax=Rhodanobacter sp. ANJX3 TaxID=2723083 RepID=UPI001611C380|nr:oxidoreductase [Rhodanobacter sp. ANJX3]MBB5358217.1 NAD(P)-dependent dehydrogenase (short-subunit alcohol dehydrogenase family) [Rhodanobacter sp. ANJX3]
MSESTPVWFITGCSTGLGRALAQRVIESGARAVVTARDPSKVADLVAGHEDRALAVALDVNDTAQIKSAVKAAEDQFGRIDVLVNNAGYGYQSTVEEAEDKEIRAQFEANVFGLFAMTQAVLPGMRTRRRGHIFNITSVAGFIGFPGSAFYAASKHAVEGWADGLAAEVEPLGIKVTCIEPGPFRTDWAGRSLKQTPSKIADYADTAAARMRGTSEGSGKQAGDPALAAQAMIDLVDHANPPRHLVLGAWGVEKVTGYLKDLLAEVEAWRKVGLATDFAEK